MITLGSGRVSVRNGRARSVGRSAGAGMSSTVHPYCNAHNFDSVCVLGTKMSLKTGLRTRNRVYRIFPKARNVG